MLKVARLATKCISTGQFKTVIYTVSPVITAYIHCYHKVTNDKMTSRLYWYDRFAGILNTYMAARTPHDYTIIGDKAIIP